MKRFLLAAVAALALLGPVAAEAQVYTPTSSDILTLTGGDGSYHNLNFFNAEGSSGALLCSSTAPAIASGFGTAPSVANNNGTCSFTINVGTSNTGTGVLTLPTAPHGWTCSATDNTTTSATVFITKVAPTSATSVTFQNYSDAAATHAWVDSDILNVSCQAY
jgi:hypothetical protein